MRLGVIDVGSNSLHLVVTELPCSGAPRQLALLRSPVRLASGWSPSGLRISDEAQARAIEALVRFRDRCGALGCDTVHVYATAAVRDAVNREDFLRRVAERTGLQPRVLDGHEEARMAWLGASHQLPPGQRTLLFDLGGASTEVALGLGGEPPLATLSLPIGHLRLHHECPTDDPPTPWQVDRCARLARRRIAPVAALDGRPQETKLVGTSGVVWTLARMASANNAPASRSRDGLALTREQLEGLLDLLARTPRSELHRLPGMDPRRRSTILSGAILVDAILEMTGHARLRTCGEGLRAGLVARHLARSLAQ